MLILYFCAGIGLIAAGGKFFCISLFFYLLFISWTGIKSVVTRSNFLLSAIENLLIASAGGAIAYWVGNRFESFMRSTP